MTEEEDFIIEDIDPYNFNLGKGSWTEKKARVDKLVDILRGDQKLNRDFKIKKISA